MCHLNALRLYLSHHKVYTLANLTYLILAFASHHKPCQSDCHRGQTLQLDLQFRWRITPASNQVVQIGLLSNVGRHYSEVIFTF